RQQRVAQMVENAHEQHHVETLAQCRHVIDRKIAELDRAAAAPGRKTRLGEIEIVGIDSQDALRAPTLHLDRVEARIAAYVENGLAGEITRDRMGEFAPLQRRVVTKE